MRKTANPIRTATLLVLLLGVIGSGQVDVSKLRRGNWRSQDVPEGYLIVKRGRYQMQSNWDPKRVEATARHMEAMFSVYRQLLRPKKTPTRMLCIKIFDKREEYLAYGGSPGAAGHYSPTDDEMVGFDTGEFDGVSTRGDFTGKVEDMDFRERMRRANAMDVLGVFSHEGWHQFFHWACGSDVGFPSWLDEGIGDYFYTARFDGKVVSLGAPMDGRLDTIQEAIESKSYVPFEKFVRFEQRDYYAQAGQNYAQGWAMVHFFMEHPGYKDREYVQRFLEIFIDQHSIEKTIPRVFGKSPDWATMEKDWKEWVLSTPRVESAIDPMVGIAVAFNKTADKHRAALPEATRKALEALIARRRPLPPELQYRPKLDELEPVGPAEPGPPVVPPAPGGTSGSGN